MIALIPLFVFIGLILVSIVIQRKFPLKRTVHIVYRDVFASGYMETWRNNFRNYRMLTVTDDELWISAWPPFSVIAVIFSAVHRIPAARIRNVHCYKSELTIEFLSHRNELKRLVVTNTHDERLLQSALKKLAAKISENKPA